MTTTIYLSVAAISLTIVGIAVGVKKNRTIQPLINLLILLLVISVVQVQFTPIDKQLYITALLASLAAVNTIAAHFFGTKKWKWALPALSIGILPLLDTAEMHYGDYLINLSNIKVWSILVIGFACGFISTGLMQLLKRFFDSYDHRNIFRTAQMVILALAIIPATFFASWYGILLLAIGYFLYNLYSNNKYNVIFIALVAIASAGALQSKFGLESIDLSIGKLIAGLFVGAAAVNLSKLASKSHTSIIKIAFHLLAIICIITVSKLDNVHPAYGGVESLLAALFGIAIALFISGKDETANILIPSTLAIALLVPIASAEQSTEDGPTSITTTATTEPVKVEQEKPGVDMSSLQGNKTVNEQNSIINFQLGPKGGVTKGAIKNFEGKINFATEITNSTFDITLPAKNLTTFNSMRDESVLGDKYLNVGKFPMMRFTSKSMVAKEDGYELQGTFTLLGKSNEQKVFIKYIGQKDGKDQFIGKASVDRTKYGMASSPQEGNIVDFTFEFELK